MYWIMTGVYGGDHFSHLVEADNYTEALEAFDEAVITDLACDYGGGVPIDEVREEYGGCWIVAASHSDTPITIKLCE